MLYDWNSPRGGRSLTDKKVVCKDCGKEFIFTANEQEFYQEHGFVEPKRCKACRDLKKANKQEKKTA